MSKPMMPERGRRMVLLGRKQTEIEVLPTLYLLIEHVPFLSNRD